MKCFSGKKTEFHPGFEMKLIKQKSYHFYQIIRERGTLKTVYTDLLYDMNLSQDQ